MIMAAKTSLQYFQSIVSDGPRIPNDPEVRTIIRKPLLVSAEIRHGHNNNIARSGPIWLCCEVVAILLCCVDLGNILQYIVIYCQDCSQLTLGGADAGHIVSEYAHWLVHVYRSSSSASSFLDRMLHLNMQVLRVCQPKYRHNILYFLRRTLCLFAHRLHSKMAAPKHETTKYDYGPGTFVETVFHTVPNESRRLLRLLAPQTPDFTRDEAALSEVKFSGDDLSIIPGPLKSQAIVR
jgi:hypothetical protein